MCHPDRTYAVFCHPELALPSEAERSWVSGSQALEMPKRVRHDRKRNMYSLFLLAVVGKIDNPLPIGGVEEGLVRLINNILRLVFIGAGIYAFITLFIAGFRYMGSAGNPETLSEVRDKIWQAFIGLVIIIATFIFAALVGQVFFGDATILLNPKIPEFGN